jgi:hypothetical protein
MGSYTSLRGDGLTSSSSSGTIVFHFALAASSHFDLFAINDFNGTSDGAPSPAGGGKLRLYTATDTILPNKISKQFVYSIGRDASISSASHTYSQTDFFGFDTTSYFGTIASSSSVVTGLKYIELNNDSWIARDNSLAGNSLFGGVLLESSFLYPPVGGQSNRGIYADYKTYIGSTYLV